MKRFFTGMALTLAAGALSFSAQAQYQAQITDVDPASGTEINSFSGITFSFGGLEVSDVKINKSIAYTVTNPAADTPTAEMGLPFDLVQVMPGGKSIYLGYSDASIAEMRENEAWPIKDPGNYALNIEEGALSFTTADPAAGGQTSGINKDIVITYSIIPPVSTYLMPALDEKIHEFEQVMLAFPKFPHLDKTADFKLTVTGPEGELACQNGIDPDYTYLLIKLNEKQTAPGDYTVAIAPGSLILVGSETQPSQVNPALSFTYTIPNVPAFGYISVSPEPGPVEFVASVGVVYTSMPHVNKSCTATAKLYFEDKVMVEYPNTSPRVQFASDTDDPKTVVYSFVGSLKDAFRESGHYKFVVPADFLYFDSGVNSPEQVFEYIVPHRFDYTIYPLEGTLTEPFDHVTVTFPGATAIKLNEVTDEENAIRLISWEAEEDIVPDITVKGEELVIKFPLQTVATQYIMEIPAGALTLTQDGITGTNQHINPIYYIPRFPQPNIDPAPGEIDREELHTLVLEMQEGYTFDIWWDTSVARLAKAYEDGTVSEGSLTYFRKTPKSMDHKRNSEITLYEDEPYRILEEGNYAVVLNRGLFSAYGPDGEQLSFNNGPYIWRYYVKDSSKVDEISDEADGRMTVYGIDGTMVLRRADRSALGSLAKGIYIVNGKKMLVK